MKVSSFYVFMCVVLTLSSIIQAKGTKPRKNFKCRSADKPQRIDVSIETGSMIFAGTNRKIRLLLLDAAGVPCMAKDLDNWGNDHARSSTDVDALCCPADFGKNNDFLSGVLFRQAYDELTAIFRNDWFVERIKVHRNNVLFFDFAIRAWIHSYGFYPSGVFRMSTLHSNNRKTSYYPVNDESF
jgi:hypothetical protein